jgi:hypothetical protein
VKVRSVAYSLFLGASVLLALQGPAHAALPSCSSYAGGGRTVDFKAFAGHRVRATYKWCNYRPSGFIGPIFNQRLRKVYSVRITFPSRAPASWGETIKLTQDPYLYAHSSVWKYRFSVEQGVTAVPWKSNYDFELQVRGAERPEARICFVGKSCSSWQN